MTTRADNVLDGMLAQQNVLRLVGQQQFAVPELAVLANDLIAALRRRMIEGAVGRLVGGDHFGHRAAHAGRAEGVVPGRMTGAASLAADVMGVGLGVQVRA